MSHFFMPKKGWLLLIGLIVLSGFFYSFAYKWMERAEQYLMQTRFSVKTESTPIGLGARSPRIDIEVEEISIGEWIETSHVLLNRKGLFPCMLRMVEEEFGVYQKDGVCIKQLKQTGENLTERDREKLCQGIEVLNEEELIELLESYHLQ